MMYLLVFQKNCENLEKDSIASWCSIILSVVAVLVAIIVPLVIANKEIKVSKFEKLNNAYYRLLLVKTFSEILKDKKFTEDIQENVKLCDSFCAHFSITFSVEIVRQEGFKSAERALGMLRKVEMEAQMLSFLISDNLEEEEICSNMITKIFDPLFLISVEAIDFREGCGGRINEGIQELLEKTSEFFNKYELRIRKALLLT